MPLNTGDKIDVLCKHCKRMWSTRVDKPYNDLDDFDAGNALQCPWCSNHVSVARRPENWAEAINRFAFPEQQGDRKPYAYPHDWGK